jgi:hypothetical protein
VVLLMICEARHCLLVMVRRIKAASVADSTSQDDEQNSDDDEPGPQIISPRQ